MGFGIVCVCSTLRNGYCDYVMLRCTECGWCLPLLLRKRYADPKPKWKEIYRQRLLVSLNWKYRRCVYTCHTLAVPDVHCMDFDEPSGTLGIGSSDGSVSVWTLDPQLVSVASYRHPQGFPIEAIHCDDKKIVSASQPDVVVFFDLAKKKIVRTLRTGSRPCSVKLAGNLLAVGCHDGSVQIFDSRSINPTSLQAINGGFITDLAFLSPKKLLACSISGTIAVFDLDTGLPITTIESGRLIKHCSFNKHTNQFVTCGNDTFSIYNVSNGFSCETIPYHGCTHVSMNNERIAVVNRDRYNIWKDGKMESWSKSFASLCFLTDSRLLLFEGPILTIQDYAVRM